MVMCATHIRRVSETLMCSCAQHMYVGCQKLSCVPLNGIVTELYFENFYHAREMTKNLYHEITENIP